MTPSPQPSPPPRFTLAGLFELIAGVGLALALVTEFGGFGVFVAGVATAIVLTADYVIFAQNRSVAWNNVRMGCLFCLVIGLLAMCCLPAVSVTRDGGGRVAQCMNSIRGIALALHGYHDDHGHFPPPYVADASGKPMHSWRVLILPYLERNDLYQAYNFNEPWNGPNNSKLASQMPSIFTCPSAGPATSGLTNYLYVVGLGRMPPGSAHQTLSDFKEPTILLVESSNARINWLEPRDLTVDEVLQDKKGPSASSNHFHKGLITRDEGWFHVAFHDASVHRLPQDIDRETLRALLTIDGGEVIDFDDLPRPGKHVRPEFWVLMSLTVAFVVLAILRRVRLARRMRGDGPKRGGSQ